MSTTQAPTPTIRNAGTKPVNSRKLFINIPVNDLQRSIEFFEALGFTFNAQFTDATATCMLVGEDAYVMLLTREKFASFAKRPSSDPGKHTNALFAFSLENREQVDALVNKAIEAGGSAADEPKDYGFMYQWSFYDLDGYHWEVFWMDPKAVQG